MRLIRTKWNRRRLEKPDGKSTKGRFNMAKIYVILADGCEEIEALTPVDLLRRAGDEVVTVSIMGRKVIAGAHGINIEADVLLEDTDMADADLIILPGGGVGTENIEGCEPLKEILISANEGGKRIAAICAAPRYLGALGFLKGKKAVVYPGLEDRLTGAEALQVPTVTDGNITTGHGPGAACDFGFELVRLFHGEEKTAELKADFVYPY